MKRIFSVLCAFVIPLVSVGAARGVVTAYTDEANYLTDITALGTPMVHEGFEDDCAWGSVRSSTAPSMTSLGITWTANNVNSEVTTGSGAALTGNYGFYTLPHGDLASGIGDGFVGTSSQLLYGVGGWIETNTPPAAISLVLDADSNPVNVDFGEDCDPNGENCIDRAILGTTAKFFGVISTDGFTRFDFLETEFTPPDEIKLIFADDFFISGDLVVSSLGDLNCDSNVNGLDVEPFLDVLLNGPFNVKADMNLDGQINGRDVGLFVSAVGSGGTATAVPEPSTVALFGVAMSFLALCRRRRRRAGSLNKSYVF